MTTKIEQLDSRFSNNAFRESVRKKLASLGEPMTFAAFKKWDRLWNDEFWGIDWEDDFDCLLIVTLHDQEGNVRGKVGVKPCDFDEKTMRVVETW